MKNPKALFLLQIVATLLVAGILQGLLNFPWWTIAVAGFLGGIVFGKKILPASLAGFLALFLHWGLAAAILNNGNNGLLADQIGMILKGMTPGLLILVTALIAGITGALSAAAGTSFRNLK